MAHADTHKGGAALLHNRVDILEVDVDVSVNGYNLGNAFGCSEQHVVGHAEGFGEREVFEGKQFVVIDDKYGVDMFAEFHDADLGLLAATAAFGAEGERDDCNDEDMLCLVIVEFDAFGNFGNHGSRTGTRATAHTGGDEEHLRVVLQSFAYFTSLVESCLAGAFGFVAGTEAKVAQRYLVGNGARIESLHVGVADNEVHALDALTEHVVDSVAAATAHTDDFDVGRLPFWRIEGEKRCVVIIFHVLACFYLVEKDSVTEIWLAILAV